MILRTLAVVALLATTSGCAGGAETPASPSRTDTFTPALEPEASSPTQVLVPDVIGKPADQAWLQIVRAGLEPVRGSVYDTDSSGRVVAQYPDVGSIAPVGSEFTIDVKAPAPKPEESAPKYSFVINNKAIDVTVDQTLTDSQVLAIVEEVKGSINEDGGYFVRLNCSTGGTKTYDNRVGNGVIAIGERGALTTNLERPGQISGSALEGATCPADPDSLFVSGIPRPSDKQASAMVAEMATIDPYFAEKPDKTVSRARDQCTSMLASRRGEGGSRTLEEMARLRFTGPHQPDYTDGDVRAIMEAIDRGGWCVE